MDWKCQNYLMIMMKTDVFRECVQLVSKGHSFVEVIDELNIEEPNSPFSRVVIKKDISLGSFFRVDGIQNSPLLKIDGKCKRTHKGKEFNVWKKHPDALCYIRNGAVENFLAVEMKCGILSYMNEAYAQIAAGLCNMKLLEFMCEGASSSIECLGVLIGTGLNGKKYCDVISTIDKKKLVREELNVTEQLVSKGCAKVTIDKLNRSSDIPPGLDSVSVHLRMELLEDEVENCCILLTKIL